MHTRRLWDANCPPSSFGSGKSDADGFEDCNFMTEIWPTRQSVASFMACGQHVTPCVTKNFHGLV